MVGASSSPDSGLSSAVEVTFFSRGCRSDPGGPPRQRPVNQACRGF